MITRIETSADGKGCTVWLGENAISFASVEEATAYVAQLEDRIAAAAHTFVGDIEATEQS